METLKENIKENYALTLAFLLILICVVVFTFTHDENISETIKNLIIGFFALARFAPKPQQQIVADKIENADLTAK